VSKGFYQQQDHCAGLASAWPTDQHKPAVMEPRVDFVMQSGYQS
jgi:hypothetical protein